ncbi:MAG TPA: hypothetical protein V6D27_12100 [Vampirovibrionales bacterium]
MKQYRLNVEEGTVLHRLVEAIRATYGTSLKKEIEDALYLLWYPHVLQQSGATPAQVSRQAQAVIHRYHQEISRLTPLVQVGTDEPVIQNANGEEDKDEGADLSRTIQSRKHLFQTFNTHGA